MNGHEIDLAMPLKNVSGWDVMRNIKAATRIQMKEQKLIFKGTVLAPHDKIPNDEKLEVILIRVPPCCACCKQEQTDNQSMFFCAGCLQVVYCNENCQEVHWQEHREFCKREAKKKSKACSAQ